MVRPVARFRNPPFPGYRPPPLSAFNSGARVLLAVLGVLSVIVGLWAVRHVLLSTT